MRIFPLFLAVLFLAQDLSFFYNDTVLTGCSLLQPMFIAVALAGKNGFRWRGRHDQGTILWFLFHERLSPFFRPVQALAQFFAAEAGEKRAEHAGHAFAVAVLAAIHRSKAHSPVGAPSGVWKRADQ